MARALNLNDDCLKFCMLAWASLCPPLAAEAHPWQVTEEVLSRFDLESKAASAKYESFVAEGIAAGKRPNLIGGGLLRSAGGWENVLQARRAGLLLRSDQRILGDSDFVDMVLDAAEEQLERRCAYRNGGVGFEQVAQRVSELLQLDVMEIYRHCKKPEVVEARSLLCYWATREIGLAATEVGAKLALDHSSVSRSALRGEQLAEDNGWRLS